MSMLMDEDEVKLQEWCQALGRFELQDEGLDTEARVFVPGTDAQDALQGLELLLRRDTSEQQPLHIRVGEWHTIRCHLLPLLQQSVRPEFDSEISYRCIKVLVRLTLPLAPLVENRIQRISQLQDAKAWIVEGDALLTLMYLLSKPLATAAEDRSTHEKNMVELGVTLIRNLLAIPDPTHEPNDSKRKLHDRCIMKMHEELVLETLCMLASSVTSTTETPLKFLLQECFAHLFRQEKNVEDLFVSEADAKAVEEMMRAEKEAEEAQLKASQASQSGGRSGSASSAKAAAKSTAAAKQTMAAAFVSSEAARLSANLARVLETQRIADAELNKQSLRHSRFGAKYSVRVVPSALGGVGLPSSAKSVGPKGEVLSTSLPLTTSSSGQVFATRFVRNVFGSSNQRRMANDTLATHRGVKVKLGSHAPRQFLSIKVKQALHATAVMLLDGGGFNTLMRSLLEELAQSTTKDLVISDDAMLFMQLSSFAMHFQRFRSKAAVRAAEKTQRAEEKVAEDRERKAAAQQARAAAEEKAALDAQSREVGSMYGSARIMASPPARAAVVAAPVSAESGSLQSHEPLSDGTAPAPLFPNAVNSEGHMTIDSQAPGAPAVSSSLAQLDDGVDETLLQPVDRAANPVPVPAADPIAAAAEAAAAAVPKKPFIRRVTFDPRPMSASLSFDAWKYLSARIKQYHADKPTPWAHLAAAAHMYTELIRCLYEMHTYGDVSVRHRSEQLRRAIFYDREHVDLLATLLKDYKATGADHTYLANLVAATHYQMRLLEDLARGEPFTILEKRRRTVRRKKAVAVKDLRNKDEAEALKAQLDGSPEGMQHEDDEKEPGAPASGSAAGDALQAMAAARKARLAALEGAAKEAPAASSPPPVSLLADDLEDKPSTLFPALTEEQVEREENEEEEEGEEGRGSSSAIEAATKALRASKEASKEAALAASGREETPVEYDGTGMPVQRIADNPEEYAGEEDEYEDVEIEEETSRVTHRREAEFNFKSFLMRFANSLVVANYLELLGRYRDLSFESIGQVLSFFERLTSVHLEGFFFQLSALVLFERIVTDPWVKMQRELDGLRTWIKGITRKFLDRATKVRVEGGEAAEGADEGAAAGAADRNSPEAMQAALARGGRLIHPNRHFWVELLFWKNMAVADKLLNEDGWFDASRDRAKSAREAELAEEYDGAGEADWEDIDEEEEEARAAARRQAEQEEQAGEAELPTTEWVDSSTSGRVKSRPWSKEEDALLTEQFKNFSDMDDYVPVLQSFLTLRSETQIKDRLKKLGLVAKAVRPTASVKVHVDGGKKGSKKASKQAQKAMVTLAEKLDRHAIYTRVPPLDDVTEELREIVVTLVQADCRSTLGAVLGDLKACRDARAALADSEQACSPFDVSASSEDDLRALEHLANLFLVMGCRSAAGKEDTWTVPPHFSSKDLDEYITLLEATLDSPYASAPREEDVENDEAISRLLSHSAAQDDDEEQEEQQQEPEEADASMEEPAAAASASEEASQAPASSELSEAAQRKAAKLARKQAKRLAEVAELNATTAAITGSQAGSQDNVAQSRRARYAEAVAQRQQKERAAAEERRRRREAEDEAAEAEFQPSEQTIVGAKAVEAARVADQQVSSSFAKADLNEFLAQKRKRQAETITKRMQAATSGESPPKRARKEAAKEATPTSAPTKRRLQRRAVQDSDDEEEAAPSQTASTEDDTADSAAAADEGEPAAVVDDAPMYDDDEPAVPVAPKKKHAARRRIASDDEDEDGGEAEAGSHPEGQAPSGSASPVQREGADEGVAPMDTDDDNTTSRAQVDMQAETQEATQLLQA